MTWSQGRNELKESWIFKYFEESEFKCNLIQLLYQLAKTLSDLHDPCHITSKTFTDIERSG